MIECGREGCSERSAYLLSCGDRCREHGIEDQPETVRFIEWGKAVIES